MGILYHYKLGFPKGFNSKVGTVPLQYTAHATSEAKRDKYGAIKLPSTLNTNKALCVEMELEEGAVSKLVYRTSYAPGLDIVIVVVPLGASFRVKTVWLNEVGDSHATLNVSRYAKAA